MAAESGRADSPLVKLLLEEPYRFEFFQAVRLLERVYRSRLPVGGDTGSGRESVRFRTHPSLAFPPSQIVRIAGEGDGGEPPRMQVAFMGLTGALGVLPDPYTELLLERVRYGDTALWAFLDIFNHRLISFMFKAWEKHRFPVAYERGLEDAFTSDLFSLIGMGTRGLKGRMSFPDQALLFYGGLVGCRPHSTSAVASIAGDFFGVPVKIEQFQGRWLRLDAESRTALGAANSALGVDTVAGARVWDNQSMFRLRIGPLDFKDFRPFLPVGSAYKPLCDLVSFMVGMELDFDVQLILRAADVPKTILTTRARRRPMLGWTTWLKTRPFSSDDSQVVLSASN